MPEQRLPGLGDYCPEPGDPYKHWPEPSFKRISTGQRRKAQGNPLQYGEFQRVPRGGCSSRQQLNGRGFWFNRKKGDAEREPGDVTAYLPSPPMMLTATVIPAGTTPPPPPRLISTNLSSATLTVANLANADLSYVDLSHAALSNAYLNDADIRDADLSMASLYGAMLNGANLSGADLSGADLTGAILDGANVSGANLDGVIFEPASVVSIIGIETARNLDHATFRANPDGLINIRKRFEDQGLTEQARKITYAINQRRTQLDPTIERRFRVLAFDLTCQYGMNPGRPLRIIALLWVVFSPVFRSSPFKKIFPHQDQSFLSGIKTRFANFQCGLHLYGRTRRRS